MIISNTTISPLSPKRSGDGPIEIGEVFSDTFGRSVLGSNYTSVGSPTVVMDGNNLVLSGGAVDFSKYLKYTAWGTCLENFSLVINLKIKTKTNLYDSFFVGIKTSSAYSNRSIFARFMHGTDASFTGKTILQTGTSIPDAFASTATSPAQPVDVNDEIRLTFTREFYTITCLTENLTKSTSTTISHTYTQAIGTPTANNTGFPYIGTVDGTVEIHDWTYSTIEKKNVKTTFVGDSITYGKGATTINNRWVNKTMVSSVNDWNVNAGGGDYTTMVLSKIDELILINPKYLVLQLGGNDLRFGVSSATTQANYTSIVNQLESSGITVIHLLATPDNTTDMTSWNTWLSSNYTTIDCFTPLKDGGTGLNATYDAGDGTHLNDAGHQLNANTVIANAPQIL